MQTIVRGITLSDKPDDEGWILVTQQKSPKKNVSHPKPAPKRVRMVKAFSKPPNVTKKKKFNFTKSRKALPFLRLKIFSKNLECLSL